MTPIDDPNRFTKTRQLIEKVKRLVQTADDRAINALLENVEQFQEKADALRELEELKKNDRHRDC